MAGKTNPMDSESLLQGSAAKTMVEFLQVAITSVVFLKGIYPSGGFERTRYRNVVVQKARHPQLRHYIQSSVASLLPFIQKGLVDRVAVIFSGPDNAPVERFIFKLDTNPCSNAKVEEGDLESSLKQFLIKMSASEPLTKALPKAGVLQIAGGRSLHTFVRFPSPARARMQDHGSQQEQCNGSSSPL